MFIIYDHDEMCNWDEDDDDDDDSSKVSQLKKFLMKSSRRVIMWDIKCRSDRFCITTRGKLVHIIGNIKS